MERDDLAKVMEELGLSAIPLAAFWAVFNSVMKAAEFVNGMRDVIITGKKDNASLTVRQRKAMLLDWFLSMCFTVIACLLFAAIIAWMGNFVGGASEVSYLPWLIWLVACFPGVGALLFVVCGVSDYRAMVSAMGAKPVLAFGRQRDYADVADGIMAIDQGRLTPTQLLDQTEALLRAILGPNAEIPASLKEQVFRECVAHGLPVPSRLSKLQVHPQAASGSQSVVEQRSPEPTTEPE